MKITIIWDITTYTPFKVNRNFGGIYHLYLQDRKSRARYQRESGWQLNMEVIYSSETSVTFQLTTRRYIPQNSTLQKKQ
jgi:hypothetical protein